jgi:tetratricopeptide (TPR) repeat protein
MYNNDIKGKYMKYKLRFIFFIVVFITYTPVLFSDSFTEAEDAFRANKMSEAIVLFEKHLQEANPNPLSYNFLALAYYQRNDKKKALDVLLRGTEKPLTDKRLLYYNAGNVAFSMGLYTDAERYFSLAKSADPEFASALINRANTRVKLAKLLLAIEDYQAYLVLEPLSQQRAKIEQMIALLENELENQASAEERRAIEEARIKEEQERLAEKEKEDALRRQKLMEEIAASLQNTESANLRAGTEGVMEYDYEFELD